MPEVDEATLAILTQSKKVLDQLNGSAETRPLLEKALKVHYPTVTTEAELAERMVQPHIAAFQKETLEPLAAELKALREQREADATARTTSQLEASFSEMRKTRGFTDDGIEAVKKLMVDNNIADPMAAAARFQELNPPQSQEGSAFSPSSWNLDQTATDVDVKGLFADEDRWADSQAANVLNEIRVGQAA